MLLRNSNLIADDINATPSGSIIEPNLNILQINVSPSNSDVSLHDEIVGITKEDVNNEMSINIDLNERIGDKPIVECFDENLRLHLLSLFLLVKHLLNQQSKSHDI